MAFNDLNDPIETPENASGEAWQTPPSPQPPPQPPRRPVPPPKAPQEPRYSFFKKLWIFLFGYNLGCFTVLALPLFMMFMMLCYALGDEASVSSDSSWGSHSIFDSTTRRVLEDGKAGSKDEVVVVRIHGIIGSGSSRDVADYTRICRELRALKDRDNVKALILDINSPGGGVMASDEICQAAREVSEAGKPVITLMRTVCASGGYYIASASNWIVASRQTLTGSIGVIMSGYEYVGLMEKVGVRPVIYRSGDMKDMMGGHRPATAKEKAYLEEMVQEHFTEFCKVVSAGRSKYYPTAESVRKAEFGDARVMSGAKALDYGLVDELGNFKAAIAKAKELGNCSDAHVVTYSERYSWQSWFLDSIAPLGEISIGGIRLNGRPQLQPGQCYYIMPEAY